MGFPARAAVGASVTRAEPYEGEAPINVAINYRRVYHTARGPTGLGEQQRAKILGLNAARLFNLEVPVEQRIA